MLRDCPGCDELVDEVPRQNRVQSDLCCCRLWDPAPTALPTPVVADTQACSFTPRLMTKSLDPPIAITLLSPRGLRLALPVTRPLWTPGPSPPA